MKGATVILQLAALSTAFVIPNEQVLNLQHVEIEPRPASVLDKLPSTKSALRTIQNAFEHASEEITEVFDRVSNKAEHEYEQVTKISGHAFDEAMSLVQDVGDEAEARLHEARFDAQGWFDSAMHHEVDMDSFNLFDHFGPDDDDTPTPPEAPNPKPPHGGPPSDPHRPVGPPHHGGDDDHHGPPPPHHGGDDHHGPPHHGGDDDHHGPPPPHHGPPHDGPPHGGPPHDGPPHHGPPPPHDGPPHDGPPHHGPPHDGPPHHGPPHHGPPHHIGHKSNMTVYQLISTSNYTTKLAKWVDEYPDIVKALNGTESNFTLFAPTDRAFEKIPDHAHKPSKEILKKILSYHISPDFYPAGRVLVTKTIPTLLQSNELGDGPLPQRLSTNIGPRGLTVNFYSRIVAVDIFGSNGVIHGVDSIILPPPEILKIISLLPSEFSTLELGLQKTGLLEELNGTHTGGTFFAPSNFAFQKLGPRINAFLFSSYGQKYLKSLLLYHVVRESHTLYSDAYYKPGDGHHDDDHKIFKRDGDCHHGRPGVPKGFFEVTLPTMLEGKELNINIARYGRLIDIRINGFSHVIVADGVAKDGVIHVVSDVLIPPKKLGETENEAVNFDEMSVEEFKERLEPFVEKEQNGWFDL